MATGIPELGMPPLDPIHLELIDFKFFNMTIEFVDVDMEGFKRSHWRSRQWTGRGDPGISSCPSRGWRR